MTCIRLSETKRRILDVLSRNRSLRAIEISEKSGCFSSSVVKALRQLRDQDLVHYVYGIHPDRKLWVRYYSLNWDNALD